jgi:hypothetical protein
MGRGMILSAVTQSSVVQDLGHKPAITRSEPLQTASLALELTSEEIKRYFPEVSNFLHI